MKICTECGITKAQARSGMCYRCYQRLYKRQVRISTELRLCRTCETRKAPSEFYASGRIGKDGKMGIKATCRDCVHEWARRKRAMQRTPETGRIRDVPGMDFSVCGHGLLRTAPCMQCAEAKRERVAIELTD